MSFTKRDFIKYKIMDIFLDKKIRELKIEKRGIYLLDSRNISRSIKLEEFFPKKLYILQSKIVDKKQLILFLDWWLEKGKNFNNIYNEVASGFWPLKYLNIISNGKGSFYILSRYNRKVRWELVLEPEKNYIF